MHGGGVPHAVGRTARVLSHPQALGREGLQEFHAARCWCLEPVVELLQFQDHHHALLVRKLKEHVHQGVVDGAFTCKKLWLRGGRLKLQAANPAFEDIIPQEGQTIEVWGVVLASVKQFKT